MLDRRLERLERELMLVARCSVLTPRERKGCQATDPQTAESEQPTAKRDTGPDLGKETRAESRSDARAESRTESGTEPRTESGTESRGEPGPDPCATTPARLDRSGYLLLSRLDAEGAMSIGQLADALQLDVSTVNRQTGALLRAGLVERIPDPDGGLARKLRVTSQGADRMAAERTCRQTGLSRLLESWTPEDVIRLEDVLTRFNREVERQEGRAWPRETHDAE
ncbi:MarR family transcriptional regulator [Streptomyces sp. 8ZJF_21]|uniref:MarR family winged helix-turn-helix transcriptional regulator n=1 Tax=Streptomyces sp. 8ZJF_21 TaxID=2903141 RepID=UPI001E577D27|nr:MarR family transcriptional regulator [Streptomyces sp. 8ZJF_21]MCD9593960.1 MarR family transcriptional regulator [Streptomyces sp. 8ZJF_21]